MDPNPIDAVSAELDVQGSGKSAAGMMVTARASGYAVPDLRIEDLRTAGKEAMRMSFGAGRRMASDSSDSALHRRLPSAGDVRTFRSAKHDEL
ncbi:hypothetical protein [Micromonospora carbonacea]|uniref:hypothetical protein n=1 Tax=Micromonospora carbonacea TaxID=47853 RepID=UPI00114C93D5|nr:hypothetical protein [Micromonospora carbonacea]